MRIAVCDDEKIQQELLKKYITEWAAVSGTKTEVISFPNAESFLFQWEDDREFDLLVLDIEMGDVSGMELAQTLRKRGEEVPILFITGYEQYMAQGYEVSAIHYLLKPVNKEKLFSVLNKLRQTKRTEPRLLFPIEDGKLAVCASDIWYVEAAGHQCELASADRRFRLRQSISEAAQLLEGRKEIVRCHRSYLVNLQHVSAIVKSEVIMDDNTRIPLSRSAQKRVNEAFIKNYIG